MPALLKQNEQCVLVTSDFLDAEEVKEEFNKKIPGFSGYLNKGQMEIFPHTDWYPKGGKFDLQRTLDMLMEKHDAALASGSEGLRVGGNPYWLDNIKVWDDFTDYEAAINEVIGGAKLLVLCTYSLIKCGVSEILDVIKNHEFTLAMDQGVWQIIK